MSKRSPRTLIIGATGFIGRFIAEASLESGRPTYILIRPDSISSAKVDAIESFQKKGAIVILGAANDKDAMEKILRELSIEVVISAIGGGCILDQLVMVQAIRSVPSVKRFLPSEFGHDIDRAEPVEPGLSMYMEKRQVRRLIEESGIPYTYICCNSIAAWPYHDNTHPSDVLPPLDLFHIYGDGNVKAYFVAGTDIGKFTMKCIDDDRTLNKTVHFRPPTNLHSINDLASIWEAKLGRKLPRVTITEDHLLAASQEMVIPESIVAALTHDIFINGCQVNYSLDKASDVEVTSLFPETPFITVEDCFADSAKNIVDYDQETTANEARGTIKA